MDELRILKMLIALGGILLDSCTSLPCLIKVKLCPQTKEEWDLKGSDFQCTVGNYTCMLTQGNDLVETCAFSYRIPANIGGCPFIKKCEPDTGPQLAVHSNNIDCPSEVPDCPPDKHDGYTISELYKYPACIRKDWQQARGTSFKHVQSSTDYTTIEVPKETKPTKTADGDNDAAIDTFTRVLFPVSMVVLLILAFAAALKYIIFLNRLSENERLPSDRVESIPLIEGHTKPTLEAHKRNPLSKPTHAEEAVRKMLLQKRFVILTGKAGTGKTYMAKNILVRLRNDGKGRPIILKYAEEWRQVDVRSCNIILLDDIFGSNILDKMKLNDWEIHFESLFSCCTQKKMYLIICCRDTILTEGEHILQKYQLFKDNIINLSVRKYVLTVAEKEEMLMRLCKQNNVNVIEDDEASRISSSSTMESGVRHITRKTITQISKTDPYYGFPQTCFLFFNDEKFFCRGVEYFFKANIYLIATITDMIRKDPQQCLILFYTFLEKYSELDCENICYEQFEEMRKALGVGRMETIDIQSKAASLCPTYLTRVNSSAEKFTFQHATIFEAVMQVFGRHFQSQFLKVAGEKMIWDFATSSDYAENPEEIVLKVKKEHAPELAEHLLKHSYWYHHKTMEDKDFATVILDRLLSSRRNSLREILKRCCCNDAHHVVRDLIQRFYTPSEQNGSNGKREDEETHLSKDDLYHSLKWALWKGSIKSIEVLETEGRIDLFAKILLEDGLLVSPLAYAGKYDSSGKSATYLLNKCKVSCDSVDGNGNTLAHRAAQFGWIQIMNSLIATFSPELQKQNDRQLLPIEIACFYGQSGILDILLPAHGSSVNPGRLIKFALFGLRFCPLWPSQDIYIDKKGDLKLESKLSSTSEAMFKKTLEVLEFKFPVCFQNEIINSIDEYGNTALHYSVLNNLLDIFKFIIQKNGSAIRARNLCGLPTAVHLCIYMGRIEMLKALSKYSKLEELGVEKSDFDLYSLLNVCTTQGDFLDTEKLIKYLKKHDGEEENVFERSQGKINEMKNFLKKFR